MERRSRNLTILLENMIEYNIMHPLLVETFQDLFNFKVQFKYIDDIVNVVSIARKSNT